MNYTDLIQNYSGDDLQNFLDGIKATGKKIVSLYGNCHMEALAMYLKESSDFLKEYYLIELPVIFEMGKAGIVKLDEIFLNSLDLLIYQNIDEDNKFGPQWATDKMITSFSRECLRLIVPNMVFNGYYPQEGRRHNTIIKNMVNFVPMFAGDKYIDNEYKKTKSIKKTIENLKAIDFIGEEEIKSNLKKSFRLLEMQDEGCDIQMRDFVIANYKDKYLFSEPKHPANIFFHEMADRILLRLRLPKLPAEVALDKAYYLSTINRLMYPAVIHGLEIKFQVNSYYIDRRLTEQRFSFEEFVEVYIRNTSEME